MCPFTAELLRVAAGRPEGFYDIVHSHYWLSGQVGWLAAERWGVPLVHTMHTMAKVKNEHLADRRPPRAAGRGWSVRSSWSPPPIGSSPTPTTERDELIRLYGADPDPGRGGASRCRPDNVPPRGPRRRPVRGSGCMPGDDDVILFVGRIQPLKAPDLLVRARRRAVSGEPPTGATARDSSSAAGCPAPGWHARTSWRDLARELGVARPGAVRAAGDPGRSPTTTAAADLVAVPSYSESFGLVALEAQASGTPVVAAGVGGLRTAVADGVSGLLVAGHDVADWADAIGAAARRRPGARRGWPTAPVAHARGSAGRRLPPVRSRSTATRRCERAIPRLLPAVN